MKIVLVFFILAVAVTGTFFILKETTEKPTETFLYEKTQEPVKEVEIIPQEPSKEEVLEGIMQRSSEVRGIYAGGAYNRSYFKNLLAETKINAIVIDVKEYQLINLSSSLQEFIKELQQDDIWTIARIAVFRDSLFFEENPDWYLKTPDSVWRDRSGYYWLDPQNQEVQNYMVEFSKKVIDFGFDELQFDYIRYPEAYGGISGQEKIETISGFFSKLNQELKEYDPFIILSVDLFGYIAFQHQSQEIGQSLVEAEKNFDYLSFMLYPSHFYHGFNLSGIQYSYPEVVKQPYDVIYYSIMASGFPEKTRPFLQDFDLKVDTARGISYDAEKIKAQIQAAEDAGTAGWLLWNPKGIYTKEALINH